MIDVLINGTWIPTIKYTYSNGGGWKNINLAIAVEADPVTLIKEPGSLLVIRDSLLYQKAYTYERGTVHTVSLNWLRGQNPDLSFMLDDVKVLTKEDDEWFQLMVQEAARMKRNAITL